MVIQRFVKVDLLGGFAVFGTIMLLVSAAFSLALQDDYWVQMKSSVLGLLTAGVFMIDGLFRKGAYFGARIENSLTTWSRTISPWPRNRSKSRLTSE